MEILRQKLDLWEDGFIALLASIGAPGTPAAHGAVRPPGVPGASWFIGLRIEPDRAWPI